MSYHIREAIPSDSVSITNCMRESFKKYVPLIGKEPEPMILNYDEVIRNEFVYVMEVKDTAELIGAIVLANGDKDFMWLDILGIYDKFQNFGYGKKLIKYGESVMREKGFKESRVFTNVKFANTIAIYKHLGYVEYDRREDRGYDRVFLKKTL